ncbi:regulatory protein RecX [Paenarthrobacter sp. Z7-10]|nr:regulatory protein RecX [Paenarthrobacter sp. Z7-10]
MARSIVLRQLTNSPKSRLQLARKLAERNIPDEVAGAVLDRFEEVQLVDDEEFAQLWVRSRTQTRSLARGALKRELADKGIGGDIAEAALGQVSDADENAMATALVRKKLPVSAVLADRAEREKYVRRLAGMLARKGYSPGLAFRLVNAEIDRLLDADDDPVDSFYDMH